MSDGDMSGQLRWLRERDEARWHLSWDGTSTVCGKTIPLSLAPLTRSLDGGPPLDPPIHAECQHLVASAVGFWEGSS